MFLCYTLIVYILFSRFCPRVHILKDFDIIVRYHLNGWRITLPYAVLDQLWGGVLALGGSLGWAHSQHSPFKSAVNSPFKFIVDILTSNPQLESF